MWTPPPSVKIHPSPSLRAATLCNKDSSYAKDTTLQVVRCFWQAVLFGNRDANCSHGALTITSQQLKECGTFCSIQSLWVIYMPDNESRAPWQTPIVTGVTLSIFITVSFFMKTDYQIILHLNICDFANSKNLNFLFFFIVSTVSCHLSSPVYVLGHVLAAGNFALLVFSPIHWPEMFPIKSSWLWHIASDLSELPGHGSTHQFRPLLQL